MKVFMKTNQLNTFTNVIVQKSNFEENMKE